MAGDQALRALVERPIRLTPNPIHRFYHGGGLWRRFRGIEPAVNSRWAEDWVASCIVASDRRPDGSAQGLSAVAGTSLTLQALIAAFPTEILGEASVRRWGADPMVQVKLVSPHGRVPLHVHPSRAFAARHLGSLRGKAEAWIIIDAPGTADGPASAGIGFREHVTRAAFETAVDHQNRPALLDSVHEAPIRPGDVVFIEPGLAHYISGGTFFVEVQEPADLGVLAEWRGFVESEAEATGGLPMDVALGSFDIRPSDRAEALERAFQRPEGVRSSVRNAETRLLGPAAWPYFEAWRLDVATTYGPDDGRYYIAVVIEGRGRVEGRFGSESVHRGDTFVCPAGMPHRYRAEGGILRILRCLGPKP